MQCYIYLVTNLINNKKYVGFTSRTPQRRWKEHITGNGCAALLDKAIKKYGAHNFQFEVLHSSDDFQATLHEQEERFIRQFDSHYKYGHGYNMSFGGTSNRRGIKMSATQRACMSIIHTGKKRSFYTCQAISKALKGKPKSIEHRNKLRIANLGKKASSDTKQKMSSASKGKQKSESHRKALEQSNRRGLYLVIFPDGHQEETNSLTSFAKQHNLTQSALSRCAMGEYQHHKGFHVKNIHPSV